MLYKIDLHIHTVLSPCASLDMSPYNIIQAAKMNGLQIIGICDHNSTKQCEVIEILGEQNGIKVLLGVEITSREEAHCLAFFEDHIKLKLFQDYIDQYLPVFMNDPIKFGDQILVDVNGNILGEEERLLFIGIDQSFDQIANKVKDLDGIFIPAHVNKPRNSVMSQLGFLPTDIQISALELFKDTKIADLKIKYPWLSNSTIVRNSDAHYLHQIGQFYNLIDLETPTFRALKEALK